MTTRPNCGNCAFSARPPDKRPPYRIVYEGALECHRYPPIVAGHTLMEAPAFNVLPGVMFPQVDRTDWCAEHQVARGRNRPPRLPEDLP